MAGDRTEEEKQAIQEEIGQLKKLMDVSKISLADVWFASREHFDNFMQLANQFKVNQDPEYAAACYVFAHPEVYRKINWKTVTENPAGWYWGEWIEEEGRWTESEIVGMLSSAYRSLVRGAVELFTGSKCYFDLMELLGNAGDEVYRVFIQALEIRRDRTLIDLSK